MRRHIIRPLLAMLEHGIAIGRQPSHKGLEIASDRRVSIFAQNQRGAGMADKNMAKTLLNPGLSDDPLYLPGDFICTPAPGIHLDALLMGMMF